MGYGRDIFVKSWLALALIKKHLQLCLDFHGAAKLAVAHQKIEQLEAEKRILQINYRKKIKTIKEEHQQECAALTTRVERAEITSNTDLLTQISNRRGLGQEIKKAVAAAARHKTGLVISISDIDHFRDFNTDHGHKTGDAGLALVGKTLKENLRDNDAVGRYGGEEFVFVLEVPKEAKMWHGLKATEKLREAIQAVKLTTDDGKELQIRMSFGSVLLLPADVAALNYLIHEMKHEEVGNLLQEDRKNSPTATICAATKLINEYINMADGALYAAKRSGRNMSCMTAQSTFYVCAEDKAIPPNGVLLFPPVTSQKTPPRPDMQGQTAELHQLRG